MYKLNPISKTFIFFMSITYLSIVSLISYAVPSNIQGIDREIIFDISKSEMQSTKVLNSDKQSQPVEIIYTENFSKITFILNQKQSQLVYALRVKDELYTDSENPDFTIYINGKIFEQVPMFTPEGLYFKIISYFLIEGNNEIAFFSEKNKKPTIEEVEMFSLEDYEDSHFARLFISPLAKTQPAAHPDQLKYDALSYDLSMSLVMTSRTITAGSLTMTAMSLDSTLTNVVLDLNDNSNQLTVSGVFLMPANQALTYNHNTSEERLYITLPSAVPKDTNFTVKVNYSGTPSNTGTFGSPFARTTHNSVSLIYTFSEPYAARKWWPCKDLPDDKALFSSHITCPSTYNAVSNGSLTSTVDNGDGTKTYNWTESYPVATYLVSVCCTNYQVTTGNYTSQDGLVTMPVSLYLYPENFDAEKGALNPTIEILDYFAELFGEYPFLTEKYANVSHASSSGMEHQTNTSMPALNLTDPYHRRNIHELTHMWFGDLITMKHFNHLWLNEGWATYCEALWQEHASGMAAYHSYVDAWVTADTYPLVSDSADAFSGNIVYRKGAWVLHMLRHIVGDTVFFQATRNYVANPNLRYGNALSIDLQQEYENVYGQSLAWFFDEWLYRAVRPSYTWGWNSHDEGTNKVLDLYITQTQSGDAYTMPIDIRVTYQGGSSEIIKVFNNLKVQEFHVSLGSKPAITNVEFDPENWILDNATQQTLKPAKPIIRSAMNIVGQPNRALVTWVENVESYCSGYQLYVTQNLTDWTLVADNNVLTKSTTSYQVTGLNENTDYYFYLRATNSSGPASDFSDVYGCRTNSSQTKILIVEGYDRWETQIGGVYNGVFYTGKSIANYGSAFNTCDNDIVGTTVNLTDYDIVIWLLGQESVDNETFSTAEQTLVQAFLNSDKNLFVSGSEIGWDLGRSGISSAGDIAFYNNYLKANYIGDDSNTYQATGDLGGIFKDLGLINFDNGSNHSYDVGYPDEISPNGTAVSCMTYVGGTNDTACIQFEGNYKLVYLAFPFETIVTDTARNNTMKYILDFFATTSRFNDWVFF